MNWISAIDLLPLAVIVICVVDLIRQVEAHKHPLQAFLLVVIAVFALHMIGQDIHGFPTSVWEVLLDLVLSVLFGFYTVTFKLKESSDEFGHSDSHLV